MGKLPQVQGEEWPCRRRTPVRLTWRLADSHPGAGSGMRPWTPGCRLRSTSCSVVSYSVLPHGLQPARLLCPWDSPGKDTGVGSLSLLQGIFLTQGSNPGLLHCSWILYCLSHQGST